MMEHISGEVMAACRLTPMYLSHSAADNLMKLTHDLNEMKITYSDLATAADIRESALIASCWGAASGNVYLTCSEYVNLGQVMVWDLDRDVNYAFCTVRYSPADLVRRVIRLSSMSEFCNSCRLMEALLHLDTNYISKNALYLTGCTARDYARVMLSLADIERDRGYDDAIDLER